MYRNLFDLGNARNLLKKELVETFIPTEAFERLLSPQNQIIIGSRGSGKTALLKMISHDHLSIFNNVNAKQIIKDKVFIGIHISTKTKFSGGLKNKSWQTPEQQEKHFNWLMNIASCMAFLETLRSCLSKYIDEKEDRISKEISIVKKIKEYWFSPDQDIYSIDDIIQELEDIVVKKPRRDLEINITGASDISKNLGLVFDLDLFDPLIAAIKIVNKQFDFPEYTNWFICIDEIEILDSFHHRILNSYMRANNGNIFFKFTTLPYCHYTLETNLNVDLDIRHDVHYVYIDQNSSFQFKALEKHNNALKLFRKRAELSMPEYAEVNFLQLFGKSSMLDAKIIDYSSIDNFKNQTLSPEELEKIIKFEPTLNLFNTLTNENTRTKGLALLRQKKFKDFGDQFGRKLRALLHLKAYIEKYSGNKNMELYYGAKTVINVADGNPRKLIKIFKEMIAYLQERDSPFISKTDSSIVPISVQNQVLVKIAEQEISRYRNEINFGTGLYDFIDVIGSYMQNYIHNQKLGFEQISSIEINSSNDPKFWKLVERAVQKGILYPNININNPDDMPYREGVFHLAFIFAPKFKLLPRKGDSRNVTLMIGNSQLKLDFDA